MKQRPPGARIRKRAAEMLDELESNSFEVVLIPAPDPKHSDHQIRVLQSGNPAWYSRLCSENVSIRGIGHKRQKRPRTFIKRSWVIRALKKIVAGEPNDQEYCVKLIDLIRAEQAQARRRRQHLSIYDRPGMSDLPF
jgi:hypothetical protein